jgi:tetratricopeptide (TPR) repeat protein
LRGPPAGLVEAAEATRNPWAISFALTAYGQAFRNADPDRARESMRRGLVIAQDSGTQAIETSLVASLANLEAKSGDPLLALEYLAVALRRYQDAGNTANVRTSLAALAACLLRLGRYEPAATIAGFGFELVTSWVREIDTTSTYLRAVLGDETYESLARAGKAMTTAAMAAYTYDQIDQARAELNAASAVEP